VLFLGGTTTDAGATVTISLSWGACGGGAGGCSAVGAGDGSSLVDLISVGPGSGQTLRLDVFLSHDEAAGILAHSFSINFDVDLLNELNLDPAMAPVEWIGTDTNPGPLFGAYVPFNAGTPSPIESTTGVTGGRVKSLESGTLSIDAPLPPTGATYAVGSFTGTAPSFYRVGQIFFVVNGAFSDGADVFSGLFNVPIDTIYGPEGDLPSSRLIFGTATLNVVPEPGTLSLLGLGLVGLTLAARSSRRSGG